MNSIFGLYYTIQRGRHFAFTTFNKRRPGEWGLGGETDRHTDIQTDRQTDRDRQTDIDRG